MYEVAFDAFPVFCLSLLLLHGYAQTSFKEKIIMLKKNWITCTGFSHVPVPLLSWNKHDSGKNEVPQTYFQY
jgi:hypothetical protein